MLCVLKNGIVLLCSRHREVRGDRGDTKTVRCDELAEHGNQLLSHTHHQASRKDESTTYTSILLIAKRSTAAGVAWVEKYPSATTVKCVFFFLLFFEVVWIQ